MVRTADVTRFLNLYKVTLESIRKDVELARKDPPFATIAAPWFPVKCYYALYYLESVLAHLLDGSVRGFEKGGHLGIRRKIYSLVDAKTLVFSVAELNRTYHLSEIQVLPAIKIGLNARSDFWVRSDCIYSVVKKLMEYKLHDKKISEGWDLRKKKDLSKKNDFIKTRRLMIPDFFYWYRIKANYRDLDYMDLECGITERDVLEYLETYNKAFEHYRTQLVKQIGALSSIPL